MNADNLAHAIEILRLQPQNLLLQVIGESEGSVGPGNRIVMGTKFDLDVVTMTPDDLTWMMHNGWGRDSKFLSSWSHVC